MTLLELMIKESIEWPEGAKFAAQDKGSLAIYFYASRPVMFVKSQSWDCYKGSTLRDSHVRATELAGDWNTAIITREQYEAAPNKPAGHVHAAIMAEYAEVAKTNPEPWEEFEWCRGGKEWTSMFSGDAFMSYNQYRRKPRTININGFEVPIPLSGRQKIGSCYWMPVLGCEFAICKMEYRGQKHDADYVASGIAHSTKEAAELHAKALLSFTKGR